MAFSRLLIPICSLTVTLLLVRSAAAVQPSELLLPATTKGYISTHDVDEVRKKFNETQLGAMVADPVMKPFIDDLRQQIGQKLERAGKKLGVKWDDLQGVYAGEVALALVQPDPKDKQSHATVLIVDITGKRQQADALLAKVDANQKAHRGVRSVTKSGGVEITVYTQPVKEGETAPEKSFLFIKDDQLVVTDHLATSTAIAGRFGGQAKDALATLPAFTHAQAESAKAASGKRHHVRWFVEPFGYAETSRAAQGGKRKRGTDILKILQAQGFTAAQGIGGTIFFATGGTEILHYTHVYAPPVKRQPNDKSTDKYNLAMRMLDFPNSVNADALEPQPWVLSDVATYLTFNWKMKEAFRYSETLVDAIAGEKGVFKEIWDSLKVDPNGPQIDIFKGLVDHLGTRATILSDVRLPVTLQSERLMALVEVTDAATVAGTVRKAFEKDPQAKKRVFKDQIIWEITQEEGLAEAPELMIEGAGFVSAADSSTAEEKEEAKKQEEEEDAETKLPNMAITVYQGHLIVATHVDFIEDLITGQPTDLGKMADYQRIRKALTELGSKNDSFSFFSRTDESYRVTYDLLKQGKLPEAETMLARLLNSLLGPREEGVVREQEIDGSKLPDFDLVKKYLGPGGVYLQTNDNGWSMTGCLLKK